MTFGSASAMAEVQQKGGGLYLRSDAAAALPAPTGAAAEDGAGSLMLGSSVGYRFTPSLGAGATLTYVPSLRFSGLDGLGLGAPMPGEARPLVGMVSGYVDLAAAAGMEWMPVQPFVVGGIGLSRSDYGGILAPAGLAGHTDFAWGAGAGLGIPLTGTVSLDVTYRYLDLGQMRLGGAPSGASAGLYQSHSATVGLHLGF